MKTFFIDSTNNIRAHTSASDARRGSTFASEKELAGLAETWSGRRLVEIWNKLPGVMPVRKFRDRKTGVRRVWLAAQNVEATKTERLVDLLKQPSGATLEALITLTGWQSHSVRGFISAQLSKRMGFRIKSFKREGQRIYRIVSKGSRGKENA